MSIIVFNGRRLFSLVVIHYIYFTCLIVYVYAYEWLWVFMFVCLRGESYLDVIARLEPIIIELERHK